MNKQAIDALAFPVWERASRDLDLAITPGGRVGDASPLGTKGPRRLDDYVRIVAHALIRKGFSKSHAIATAKNSLKRWRRGGGHVRPQVQAGASAHLGIQEALDKRRGGRTANLSVPAPASAQDGPRVTLGPVTATRKRKRTSAPRQALADRLRAEARKRAQQRDYSVLDSLSSPVVESGMGRDIDLVGPKGYRHGWIYVGGPGLPAHKAPRPNPFAKGRPTGKSDGQLQLEGGHPSGIRPTPGPGTAKGKSRRAVVEAPKLARAKASAADRLRSEAKRRQAPPRGVVEPGYHSGVGGHGYYARRANEPSGTGTHFKTRAEAEARLRSQGIAEIEHKQNYSAKHPDRPGSHPDYLVALGNPGPGKTKHAVGVHKHVGNGRYAQVTENGTVKAKHRDGTDATKSAAELRALGDFHGHTSAQLAARQEAVGRENPSLAGSRFGVKAPAPSNQAPKRTTQDAIDEARAKPYSSFPRDYRGVDDQGNKRVLINDPETGATISVVHTPASGPKRTPGKPKRFASLDPVTFRGEDGKQHEGVYVGKSPDSGRHIVAENHQLGRKHNVATADIQHSRPAVIGNPRNPTQPTNPPTQPTNLATGKPAAHQRKLGTHEFDESTSMASLRGKLASKSLSDEHRAAIRAEIERRKGGGKAKSPVDRIQDKVPTDSIRQEAERRAAQRAEAGRRIGTLGTQLTEGPDRYDGTKTKNVHVDGEHAGLVFKGEQRTHVTGRTNVSAGVQVRKGFYAHLKREQGGTEPIGHFKTQEQAVRAIEAAHQVRKTRSAEQGPSGGAGSARVPNAPEARAHAEGPLAGGTAGMTTNQLRQIVHDPKTSPQDRVRAESVIRSREARGLAPKDETPFEKSGARSPQEFVGKASDAQLRALLSDPRYASWRSLIQGELDKRKRKG